MSPPRPALSPLTPVVPTHLSQLPLAVPGLSKIRTYSSTSSISSASSTYSRAPEDLIDRLAAQEESTTFSLWSAGNVRLQGLDLTIPPCDAADLIHAMGNDERFAMVSLTYLDGQGGDDWKISFRRTSLESSLTSPALSDTE